MIQSGPGTTTTRNRSIALPGLGLLTLGIGLLGGVAGSACGIGTDPALQAGRDGATTGPRDAGSVSPDASTWSTVPEGRPEIDQMTHDSTAIATFALG